MVENQHWCTVQLRYRRRPALQEERSAPRRLADHTLLLQERRYPQARYLRWTKYDSCSNSIFTYYNRRFLNTQFNKRRPHRPRIWLRWWKLCWLASPACCSCIFWSLSSQFLVYGAYVAAVATMVVSVLAWDRYRAVRFYVFVAQFLKTQPDHTGALTNQRGWIFLQHPRIHDAVVGFVDRCLSWAHNLAASTSSPRIRKKIIKPNPPELGKYIINSILCLH